MLTDPTLVGSWPCLAARLDRQAVVAGWLGDVPGLDGVSDVGALRRAWSDPARKHRVGAALVRLAAIDGAADDDALLVLLHLLGGIVWSLKAELGDLGRDVSVVVVSELACRIRSYPWRTRRGGLVANLRADVRAAVLAEFRPGSRRHPERVERLTCDGDTTKLIEQRQIAEAAWLSRSLDVEDLLAEALAAGVDRDELELFVDFELSRGQRGAVADETVAARHHIHERTLYRRRARTRAALRRIAASLQAAA